MMENKSYLYILAASIFWSVQGVIGKFLSPTLMPMQIAFCRVFIGFLFIFMYTLIYHRNDLLIDIKGMIQMAVVGLICQTTLNIFFFYSVTMTSVAAATSLLYTAPIFAMIISRLVFKELFTRLKVFALTVCILGCYLTVTMGDVSVLSGSTIGLIAGIGSGLAYSMNAILGKLLMKKYNPWVILTYTFGFGSLFLVPFVNPFKIIPHFTNIQILSGAVLLGFVPTFLAIGSYFTGLLKGAEPSKVGIVATAEVALAIIFANIFFDEPLGVIRIIGIILIFGAVYILYIDNKTSNEKVNGKLIKEVS